MPRQRSRTKAGHSSKRKALKSMTIDPHGNVLLPTWFLRFLSIVVTLVTIGVIPWAAAVTKDLSTLANTITALRSQSEGQAVLQNEVIQNINKRIERIEMKLDRFEQQQQQLRDGP